MSILDEDQREIYIETIKENPTIFDRFVSRGDVRDPVDISHPRAEVERITSRAIRSTTYDKTTRYVPVVGLAGSGKTHFYWALKDKQSGIQNLEYSTVYVSSPPAPVRMLLHIYICVMDEIGLSVLKQVSKRIVETYGGAKRRFKLFGPEMEEIIGKAVRDYPGMSSDVVRALIIYEMASREEQRIAEQWLLGETLSEEELENLGVGHIIEEDDVCLATLKLLADNIDHPIILYFDELEIPYRIFGEEAETRLFETIKRIYNEVKSIVVVTACLSEVWDRVYELADPALQSRMEQITHLAPFSVEDIKNFYVEAQLVFWDIQNLNPPDDHYFPLAEGIFPLIHKASNGIPRLAIRLIRDALDYVLFGISLPPSLSSVKTVSTPQPSTVTIEESTPSTLEPTSTEVITPSIPKYHTEHIPDEEIIAVDVNPGSVGGSAMASLLTAAKGLGHEKRIKIEMDYKFESKGKQSKLNGAIILDNDPPVGIEVPSCKSFDRSGGVAAYYSAKRIHDALMANSIVKGCLIVPKKTGGNKYKKIVSAMGDNIITVELDQSEAEELIRKSRTSPIEHLLPFIKLFFPEYKQPQPLDDPTSDPNKSKESNNDT